MRAGWVVATMRTGARALLPVAIAETVADQVRGFAGWREEAPRWGMAFPVAPSRPVAMSMDGVAFPLDMVFVDETARVVLVEEAAPFGAASAPWWPVALVVEAPSGWVRAVGLTAGDEMRLIGW